MSRLRGAEAAWCQIWERSSKGSIEKEWKVRVVGFERPVYMLDEFRWFVVSCVIFELHDEDDQVEVEHSVRSRVICNITSTWC